MDRVILHSDLNNFYASVECRDNPELKGIPVAVCGDVENRHGIVLAKNELAKKCGVKTAEALWEAKMKCPDITFVRAHFYKYQEAARKVRSIYYQYTDQVENFGMDECWLDVTGSVSLFGSGEQIANEIRERIKSELALTVSVGVSYNKIFAKLGSDRKKPDGTTVITRDNYKDVLWPLPAEELIYVGRATSRKLRELGIYTIGEIANTSLSLLKQNFGIHGETLYRFSNGMDNSPVSVMGTKHEVKSIGNSSTAYRDLDSEEDVKILLWSLCESVSARLRESNMKCTVVTLHVRDKNLRFFERQMKVDATCVSKSLFDAAFHLYCNNQTGNPIRSLGVRGSGLILNGTNQFSLFREEIISGHREQLEGEIDRLSSKYGSGVVFRGVSMIDRRLSIVSGSEDSLQAVAFIR